jgi:DNA-binding NarL/FixJ family response regulator
MADRIRIMVAEDHPLVRSSLTCLLETQGDFHVVGEAEDGHVAVELARTTGPEVIVMDYDMPRMNGPAATQQIVAEFPQIRVIGFSWHDDRKVADDMLAAGAIGFLTKGGDSMELIEAIRQFARGGDASETDGLLT